MKKDLSDTTFIIPLRINRPDRLQNALLVCEYLTAHLSTHVLVAEYDREPRFRHDGGGERLRHLFLQTHDSTFWKTRIINEAVEHVTTPFFVLQDADVVIEPEHLQTACHLLRQGIDLVYPFRNDLMWIPAEAVAAFRRIDLPLIRSWRYELASGRGADYIFVGLCNFIRLEAFRRIGKFNQNIRSWGYEDVEFFERAKKLGLRIRRLANMPYHLGHGRTEDSNPHNRHYQSNREHYERTLNASADELDRLVKQWPW